MLACSEDQGRNRLYTYRALTRANSTSIENNPQKAPVSYKPLWWPTNSIPNHLCFCVRCHIYQRWCQIIWAFWTYTQKRCSPSPSCIRLSRTSQKTVSNSKQIARQLTLKEEAMFQKLTHIELVDKAWLTEEKEIKAPTIWYPSNALNTSSKIFHLLLLETVQCWLARKRCVTGWPLRYYVQQMRMLACTSFPTSFKWQRYCAVKFLFHSQDLTPSFSLDLYGVE